MNEIPTIKTTTKDNRLRRLSAVEALRLAFDAAI